MPPALTWLRTHRRTALELLGLVVVFCAGWALHRPAPRLEAQQRETAQVQQQQHRQVQASAVVHQVEQGTTIARAEQHRRVRTHREVHVLPSGERTIVTDTAEDDSATLETAQQVTVSLDLSSVLSGVVDRQETASASREASVIQTPAAPPSWRVGGLAGLSASGPVYGGEVSRRVLGPIWVGAWGLSVPAGGVSVGVEW